MDKVQQLKEGELRAKHSRRQFLRDSALAIGSATAIGALANRGLNYAGDHVREFMSSIDVQLRDTARDLQAVSGLLTRKFTEQAQELERNYRGGRLRIFEDAGIATPQEIERLESLIANYERIEQYYTVGERLREFKDRVDRKILTLDSRVESSLPDVVRRANDGIRDFFGQKSGEEGQRARRQLRERLDTLCRLYTTNEDNRVAQGEVLETLNRYIRDTQGLPPESAELFRYIRDRHREGTGRQAIEDFLRNTDQYDPNREALLRLRSTITGAEQAYAKIRENREYLDRLSGLLNTSISQVEEIRTQTPREFAQNRERIDARVTELTTEVDRVIAELKSKGYQIETRADYVAQGTAAERVEPYLQNITIAGTALAAAYAGLRTLLWRRHKHAERTQKGVATEAIGAYNDLATKYNDLLSKNDTAGTEEKSLNPPAST